MRECGDNFCDAMRQWPAFDINCTTAELASRDTGTALPAFYSDSLHDLPRCRFATTAAAAIAKHPRRLAPPERLLGVNSRDPEYRSTAAIGVIAAIGNLPRLTHYGLPLSLNGASNSCTSTCCPRKSSNLA